MGFGVLLAWIDVVTGCSDQWLRVFDTLVICFRLSQFYLRLIPRSVVLHIFGENNQRLQLSFSWTEETQTIQSREVKTSDCRARADRTEANALRRSFSRAASKEFSIRLHLPPTATHRHWVVWQHRGRLDVCYVRCPTPTSAMQTHARCAPVLYSCTYCSSWTTPRRRRRSPHSTFFWSK